MGIISGLTGPVIHRLVLGGVVAGVAGKIAEPAINAAHGFVTSLFLKDEPTEEKEYIATAGADSHADCQCKNKSASVAGTEDDNKPPAVQPSWFKTAMAEVRKSRGSSPAFLPPMPPETSQPKVKAAKVEKEAEPEEEVETTDDDLDIAGLTDNFASGLDDDDTGGDDDDDDTEGLDDDDDTEGLDDDDDTEGLDDDDTGGDDDDDDTEGLDDDDDTEGLDDDDDTEGLGDDDTGGDDDTEGLEDLYPDVSGTDDGEDCGCNI